MTRYDRVRTSERLVDSGQCYVELGVRDCTEIRLEGDTLVLTIGGDTYHYRGQWSGRVLREEKPTGAVSPAPPAQPAPAAVPRASGESRGPLRGSGGRR